MIVKKFFMVNIDDKHADFLMGCHTHMIFYKYIHDCDENIAVYFM